MSNKEFNLDNVLNGDSSLNKLKNIYRELKEQVLKGEPIKTSTKPLITIEEPNWIGDSYKYEIYSLKNKEAVMIELYSSNQTCSKNNKFNEKFDERNYLEKMNISICNSRRRTVSKIENILSKYPRNSKP